MASTIKQYKHLFFDLDHTLWDFEANAKETLRLLSLKHDFTEKGVHDFDLFFERYSYHNNKLWERYTKGTIKQDELRWKRMWLSLLDFKIADETLSKALAVDFLNDLPNRKMLFPYTIEILEYLTANNYVLHLITNGFDSIQYNKLCNSNLTKYFKEVITSEKANSLKPNKEIFEFALKATNANIDESIMIGDNIDADIKGAMNAGLDTVFVNHLRVEADVKPTYTIHHLKELEEIF
ncbi:MAG TPA: YjjG family noncanonical pyrimidine nucleotidase [Parafilimonas sp.]|nr:YjjG family noncanonical pyrimidine nucleotidase [Parafilimonas sp.]